MEASFSDAKAHARHAPPPTSPGERAADPALPEFAVIDAGTSPAAPGVPRPRGRPFDAELDVRELGDKNRLGAPWAARAREVSRSHLILRSRRMCYVDKHLLIKVHLIDHKPVGLFGQVRACDYDGEGLYRVEVDLLPIPSDVDASPWFNSP